MKMPVNVRPRITIQITKEAILAIEVKMGIITVGVEVVMEVIITTVVGTEITMGVEVRALIITTKGTVDQTVIKMTRFMI